MAFGAALVAILCAVPADMGRGANVLLRCILSIDAGALIPD